MEKIIPEDVYRRLEDIQKELDITFDKDDLLKNLEKKGTPYEKNDDDNHSCNCNAGF